MRLNILKFATAAGMLLVLAGATATVQAGKCDASCAHPYRSAWKTCGGDCSLAACQQAVRDFYACMASCPSQQPSGLCGIPNP